MNLSFHKRRFRTQFLKPTWCGIFCVLGYSSWSINRCSWIFSSIMTRAEFYFQGWYLYQPRFAFHHLHLHSSRKQQTKTALLNTSLRDSNCLQRLQILCLLKKMLIAHFSLKLGVLGQNHLSCSLFCGNPDINSCSTQMISSSLSENITLE